MENNCLECEVKDAEIYLLSQRIQILVRLLAMKNMGGRDLCSSGNKNSNAAGATLGVPQGYSVPLSNTEAPYSGYAAPISPPLANHTVNSSKSEWSESPNPVELMPGSGVFVSLPMLAMALRSSKTGTQLARKLMDLLWDRETLACSTLTPRASNYHQLDQNTIRAIEAYCLSFDKDATSKEVRASMSNKCSQARVKDI